MFMMKTYLGEKSTMLELRASCNDVVAPYAEKFGAKFVPGRKPGVKVDVAMPCATQMS